MLYILVMLGLILVGLFIAASQKPDTVHYERSTVINAPPDRILPHISDFRKWAAWSPWDKMDPAMKRSYSGAESGVGARYAWVGNKKVGEGNMLINEVSTQGVKLDLNFLKPWKAECKVQLAFTPSGNGTQVRWIMDGPNSFMGKLFSLFVNMDKMIGKDFETGLSGLKAVVEKA